MSMTMRYSFACAVVLMILTAIALVPLNISHSQSETSPPETYIVLYKAQSVPSDASKVIRNAGGTLVKSYNEIGVAIATSGISSFRDKLLSDSRIEGAASTATFAAKLRDDLTIDETSALPSIP